MDILSLIIFIAFLGCLFIAAMYIVDWMKLADPWGMIVRVLVGLLMLVIILGIAMGRVPIQKFVVW